jgi:hypothetical protein
MDCECVELTGSGRLAIAASIASFMMPIVSDGTLAFEKSFIVQPYLVRCLIAWAPCCFLDNGATLGKPAANYWPVAGLVLEGKQI